MTANGVTGIRGRRLFHPLLSAIAVLAIDACSPLIIFDTLVPKDRAVEVVVKNARFGDDSRQKLDVYRPRKRGRSELPIIVFIYGGSWNSGSKDGYSFVGRALAAKGFLVAIPDYRLVPGVRFPVFLEDNAAAVKWIVAHARSIGGDPDRIVFAGHSAGAYNAAMLALDPRWLGDDRRRVRGLIGLAGPYDFLPLKGKVVETTFAGTVDQASTQPVNFVHAGDPPAFLATGDQDDFVQPRNSDSLAAKYRTAGIKVDRRTYRNVGHVGLLTAIARPLRGRATVLDDISSFALRVTAK